MQEVDFPTTGEVQNNIYIIFGLLLIGSVLLLASYKNRQNAKQD
ncbi:MAG: LPXTG cell wall anchor domain-containing protein [Clostridiaceae bacterium]|nr:LPXTG cell wall anchor domain-containing protein [Clostridiaceae bacterium]